MDNLLNVSSNPHVRHKDTTAGIMLDVIIALLPASVFGVYYFGYKAALLILVTVLTCVLTEAIYEFGMKKKLTITDFSAAVTGLLLALNLPYDLPIWMAVIGGIFAILIVKQVFGGLGQNFMNPALAARCFLVLSFGTRMTVFTLDGVTTATPLKVLKDTSDVISVKDMFVGTTAGTIGETSIIALAVGALYLLIKKVIDLKIPFTYIATFALFILVFGDKAFDIRYLCAHLCGGGLMLGAFFMATDYVTAPMTPKGKYIYGAFLGILTAIFRLYGPNAEGVSFAIIIGNLLVPLIDKVTKPKAFGLEGKKHERAN